MIRRFFIVPRIVDGDAVAEEACQELSSSLVDFTNFSHVALLHSGLVRAPPRRRDGISLFNIEDETLVALDFSRWSYNQARDARRGEGEEEFRLIVLQRASADYVVTL